MALDNIDIDVNNGLETAETRSVVGTENETKSDVVTLTEDEKRTEIMNVLINNQKYHNMLEVCTRLKFDLNGLIIMNMNPTELANLNRNNVQSIVSDALESTRKFITESTTGLVLRSDGTIDVAESIAEAVDRGGVFDNGFIAPEITTQVRLGYEERLEKYLGGDKRLEQLYDAFNEYTPEISFENNTFRVKLNHEDIEHLNRIYRTYGKKAVERELLKRAFEANRKDIIKQPEGQFAFYIKNEIDAMEAELKGVTDPKQRQAIISNHTRNINILKEHLENPEMFVEEADGTFKLTNLSNDLLNDEKKNEIELVREFKETMAERQEADRPLSYTTQVEGLIYSCLVCDGVYGLKDFQDNNLDQLANLCPQLVIEHDDGSHELDVKGIMHLFKVQFPEIDLRENATDKIKSFFASRTISAIEKSIDYALSVETDETKLLEGSRFAAAGNYKFKLNSLDTAVNTKRPYTRTEIINELENFGRMLSQIETYYQELRTKHNDDTIDEEFVKAVLEKRIIDPRFDEEDLAQMERVIMTPNVRKKLDTVMNDWLNDSTFKTAFSSVIKENPDTHRLELDYKKVKEEYDRNKTSVEINGHLVSQEEIRKDLFKRYIDHQNELKGKRVRKHKDVSYSFLANKTDAELIKIVRENMPYFYNSITIDTSKDSIECLSLSQLMDNNERRESETESRRRLDYKFLIDGKVYNALGVAKLFNDCFQELKNNKKWQSREVSMNDPLEELLDEIPEKRDVIARLIATKSIMEDADNFELFSSYYEDDSNKINVGRLQRLVKQMEATESIPKSDYEPQRQYTVLGRNYSKLALIAEYLDIKNFENDKNGDYYRDNEKKLKLFEEHMKKSPEFARYIDSKGNININLLRVYKDLVKRKIRASQFGFSSRPDDVIVKIGNKEYKQLDIPTQIVKLTRSQRVSKNKAEIEQLLNYVKENPDLYGKELIDNLNEDIYQGSISPEFVEAALDLQPKYTVDKAVFTREEVIRLLAEKHLGRETEENTRKYELYKFHNTQNARTVPIKLAEAMVTGKYGKDFKDILYTQGQMTTINWDKLMEEYYKINSTVDGKEDLSKTVYNFCRKKLYSRRISY